MGKHTRLDILPFPEWTPTPNSIAVSIEIPFPFKKGWSGSRFFRMNASGGLRITAIEVSLVVSRVPSVRGVAFKPVAPCGGFWFIANNSDSFFAAVFTSHWSSRQTKSRTSPPFGWLPIARQVSDWQYHLFFSTPMQKVRLLFLCSASLCEGSAHAQTNSLSFRFFTSMP